VTQRILDANIPDEIRTALLAERSRKHQTGVKGVLADYKTNKALKALERDLASIERDSKLWEIATGQKVKEREKEEERIEKNFVADSSLFNSERQNDNQNQSDDEDEDEDDDDEDDAFMREFRAKRIQGKTKYISLFLCLCLVFACLSPCLVFSFSLSDFLSL
jgi:hypothetical protein